MYRTIYLDDEIIVCHKPRGVLSEGEGKGSLPGILAEELSARGEPARVFPVHRLDRDTEGLMVYARTSAAAAALSRAITEGELKKEYIAVVCGSPEEEAGTLTDLLFYDRGRGKSIVVTRPRKGVREAALTYRFLERWENRSLLRIELQTGRTHQIRAQFASRGLPLAGDRRYGAPAEGTPMALFSCRLAFPHPKTGAPMAFEALPTELEGTAWNGWSYLI